MATAKTLRNMGELAGHTAIISGALGYLPPAPLYDADLYQVWQTPIDRGGLESLTAAAASLLDTLTRRARPALVAPRPTATISSWTTPKPSSPNSMPKTSSKPAR